jgi:hypothetical protein
MGMSPSSVLVTGDPQQRWVCRWAARHTAIVAWAKADGSGIRRSYKALYDRAKDRGEILETLGEVAREAKPARRRAPDWRPAVDQIAAEALGRTDTALQGAAFTLLKQSARLAQAAVSDDREGIREAVRKAERALRKVLGSLED